MTIMTIDGEKLLAPSRPKHLFQLCGSQSLCCVPVAKAFPKTAIADHSEGVSFQRISCYGHPYKANPLHWVSPLPHRFLWSGWNKTASAARVCPRANCMGGMRPMCQRQMLGQRWLSTPIMKFIEGPHSSFFRGQSWETNQCQIMLSSFRHTWFCWVFEKFLDEIIVLGENPCVFKGSKGPHFVPLYTDALVFL
jgi:hypothetical protein